MNSFNTFNSVDLILQILNNTTPSQPILPCVFDKTNHIDMNLNTTAAVPNNSHPELEPSISVPSQASIPNPTTDNKIIDIVSAYAKQSEIDVAFNQFLGSAGPNSIPAQQPEIEGTYRLLNDQITADPLSFEYLVNSASMPNATVRNPTKALSEKAKSPESKSNGDNGPKYLCEICNKKFPRPSALATHVFSHTGEKPYKCEEPGCEQVFSVRSNMQRHMKAKHKREPITKMSRSKRSRYYSNHPYMLPDMLYGASIHPSQHSELVFYPPVEAPCFFYPHPHDMAFPPMHHPQLMSQPQSVSPQPGKDHVLASKLDVELDTLLNMLGNSANGSATAATASDQCLTGLGLRVDQPKVQNPVPATTATLTTSGANPALIPGQPICSSLDTDSGSLYGETPETPLSHGLRTPMASYSAPFYGSSPLFLQQACPVSVYVPALPVASTGIEYSETSRMLNQTYTMYPKTN